MGKWQNLTAKQKAQVIRFAIQNGVSDINSIRDTYNLYSNGANLAHKKSGEEQGESQNLNSSWLPDFTYNPSMQSNKGKLLLQSILQDEDIQRAIQQKTLQRQAEMEARRRATHEIYNGMPNPGAGYVSGTDPLLQAIVDMTPAGDAEMATEAASELRNGNLKEAGILSAALLLPNLFNKYILKKTLKDNTGLIKFQNSVEGLYPPNFYYDSASDLLKRLKADGYDLSGIDADKLIQARLETLLNSNQGNRLMLFDGSTIKALDVGNIKSADDYYIQSNLIDKSSGEGLIGKLKLYKEKDNSYHPIMISSWKPRNQVGRDLYDAAQQAAMEQGMNGSVLAERLLMPEKTVGTLNKWFPNKEVISNDGVWDILSMDRKSRVTMSGQPVYRLNGVERPSNLKHIVFDPSIVDENGIMHLGNGMYHSTGGPLYPFSFEKNPYLKTPIVRYDEGGFIRDWDSTLTGKLINYVENSDSIGWVPQDKTWEHPTLPGYDKNQIGMGVDKNKTKGYAEHIKQRRNGTPYLTEKDERALRHAAIEKANTSANARYKFAQQAVNRPEGTISKVKDAAVVSAIYNLGATYVANGLFEDKDFMLKLFDGTDQEVVDRINQEYKKKKRNERIAKTNQFLFKK